MGMSTIGFIMVGPGEINKPANLDEIVEKQQELVAMVQATLLAAQCQGEDDFQNAFSEWLHAQGLPPDREKELEQVVQEAKKALPADTDPDEQPSRFFEEWANASGRAAASMVTYDLTQQLAEALDMLNIKEDGMSVVHPAAPDEFRSLSQMEALIKWYINEWNAAYTYRDTAVRPMPGDTSKKIVFAGGQTWGDEPEGGGYLLLKGLEVSGLADALGIE